MSCSEGACIPLQAPVVHGLSPIVCRMSYVVCCCIHIMHMLLHGPTHMHAEMPVLADAPASCRTRSQVLAGIVEEEVLCAPLLEILQSHGMCRHAIGGDGASSGPSSSGLSSAGSSVCPFDVFATDTEVPVPSFFLHVCMCCMCCMCCMS